MLWLRKIAATFLPARIGTVSRLGVPDVKHGCSQHKNRRTARHEQHLGLHDLPPRYWILKHVQPAAKMMRDVIPPFGAMERKHPTPKGQQHDSDGARLLAAALSSPFKNSS
jgi:hypothetical protein